MGRTWSFGQKIGGGFTLVVALALVIGVVATYALRAVVSAKDQVISHDAQSITDAQRLATAAGRSVASMRGYILSPQQRRLDEVHEERQIFLATLEQLRKLISDDEGKTLLDTVASNEEDYNKIAQRLVTMRQNDAPLEDIVKVFDEEVSPNRIEMTEAIDRFTEYAKRGLEQRKQAATAVANSAITLAFVIAAVAVLLSIVVALVLTRTVGRQVGTAVSQVQSSSAELQAAANQQASGAKEQASAMTEISTTISELLATSRQIAESAQRVAQIAVETSASARTGDTTVERAHEAVSGIRRQVDLIVTHMLDLGKKSQQIGTVLDILAELSEQTNILAINATIEAAGAGEAGRRFAVVAEEIRKLADRVGGSTKEIRTMIDEVRGSVNATVMTTETGSKSVEAGARQFAEVATSFKQIVEMVGTAAEAAREIELSTKQQATAVEQVNIAITNVAQATKESEASTGQTLQTASQLAGLSRDLMRIVQPGSTNGAATIHH